MSNGTYLCQIHAGHVTWSGHLTRAQIMQIESNLGHTTSGVLRLRQPNSDQKHLNDQLRLPWAQIDAFIIGADTGPS